MIDKRLKIADRISLPLDAATQTFAFIARRGGGKTYAAGKLVELLLDAGVQCVVIDAVGNWYGLRLAADGKAPGYDIPVIGGLRGDIPLEATGGKLIADIVVETGRSLILDVSQFSLQDRKRFCGAFGEYLWTAKKRQGNPSPVMLVIEESQLIVPQRVLGDDAKMVGVFEEIIRLGRNYGIGCVMISQRPQSVNKEVLNQAECLFVGQVNGAQERKALRDWITHQGMDENLVDELPGLGVGTMYVWSPQWLRVLEKVRIEKKRTFDASATPKVGENRQARELRPLDLDELKKKMAATIERAKSDDPRELRRKITDLEAKLRGAARVVEPDRREIERAVRSAIGPLQKEISKQQEVIKKARAVATNLMENLSFTSHPAAQTTQPPPRVLLTPAESQYQVRKLPSSNGNLPVGEKMILKAIAQYPEGAQRDQLSVLTGYKRSSRDTYIARLKEKGFLEISGQEIVATTAGIQALGPDYEPLPSGEELRAYWMQRLPEGERRILKVILHAHGEAIERQAIDEAVGYQRSSRDTYLSRLAARRLVEPAGSGLVRASKTLFE